MPGFLLLSAIWGGSFALIKVAVDAGVPPVWVACWRCVCGALTLLAVALARRDRLPADPATWAHGLVVALLANALPFTLLATGELRVSSVLAGMLNATTPLTTLLFALALLPEERLTRARLAGLLTGFAGVLVVLGVWQAPAGGTLAGALLCLGSTVCYGAAFSYARRFFTGRAGSAVTLSAVQITLAAALLLPVAPLLAGPPGWPGAVAAGALLVLGAAGTGVAYLLNVRVIRRFGASFAAGVTYLTPVWAALLGGVLLAEPVHWYTGAGAALVVAGVLLARRATTTTAAAPPQASRAGQPIEESASASGASTAGSCGGGR
jgi:drug/metabolite transporter (DMT)-like permease